MKKAFALLSILLLMSATIFAQTADFVKSDSIVYPIHRANIGKVAFLEKTIAIENFKQVDFLAAFELKENADLSIRVFLGNSLTNYLHLLVPQLTPEELSKSGNYQFTFLVDGKK